MMIPSADPDPPLLLLVDDQPANLHLLVEILRNDYGITTTTRGAEVLELAGREPHPDLILLDVMMPDVNGLEVLRRLRANPPTSDIPVILISADGTELTQYTGLEQGADDYVVKPIQPRVLLTRVRNLLRRKQAEDALRESEAQFRGYFEQTLMWVDHDDQPIKLTLSAGIASWANEQESLDDLFGRADQALYRAKAQGRNCVVVAESLPHYR
jgi:PleD family two-component response regulator